MEQLTKLDKAILGLLALKYPIINEHLPYIRVRERELTGVGMYVNFIYMESKFSLSKFDDGIVYLTVDEDIYLPNLSQRLFFLGSVLNGLINYLEILTYEGLWDGTVEEFNFIITGT